MVNSTYQDGVGHLVVDRFDFEKHLNGTSFNHTAGQITLNPTVSVSGSNATQSTVQSALEALVALTSTPTVPLATNSNSGLITLAGDLGGNATIPIVVGLGGVPLASTSITLNSNNINSVLTYTGSSWEVKTITSLGAIKLAGDLGNTATSPKVLKINGTSVSANPSPDQVLVATSGSASTWQKIGNAQIDPSASIAGSKINPVFSGTNFISVGANSASSGAGVRLSYDSNGSGIFVKDGGGANKSLVYLDGTNVIRVGDSSAQLYLQGGTIQQVKVIGSGDTPYSVDASTKDTVILVSTFTGAVTINLPTATSGRTLKIKDIGGRAETNHITLHPASGASIDGLTDDYIMDSNYQGLELIGYNNSWWIVSTG